MNPISLDRVTIVSSLIRFTSLTQSHLLLKNWPKKVPEASKVYLHHENGGAVVW